MKKFLRSIQTRIIVGGVLVTPVVISCWIILMLVDFLTTSTLSQWIVRPVKGLLPSSVGATDDALLNAAISLIVVLAFLFFIGLIFRNFLGRRLYRLLDHVLERIPLINRIYMFVRTVSESIVSQKDTMFKEVVLIEYPRREMYSIGFVSAQVPPPLRAQTTEPEQEHIYVFIPTTPNPTSGYLLLVPRKDAKPLELSSAEAMKLIVSAGASNPMEDESGGLPSLLDKLEKVMGRPPGESNP